MVGDVAPRGVRGALARADAVWNSDAAVRCAGEVEARNPGGERLNRRDAIEVADVVLRHRAVESVDAAEHRRRANAHHVVHLADRQLAKVIVRRVLGNPTLGASEKDAKE